MHEINPYHFGLVIRSELLDQDLTAVIEAEERNSPRVPWVSPAVSLRTGG
jgi:hypothetical protein